MKQRQFVHTCAASSRIFDGGSETGLCQFHLECLVPVRAERMIVAETVIGEGLALVNKHRVGARIVVNQNCLSALLLAQHT